MILVDDKLSEGEEEGVVGGGVGAKKISKKE